MIGLLPSFMQAGMMFGAVGWGACTSAHRYTLYMDHLLTPYSRLRLDGPDVCI